MLEAATKILTKRSGIGGVEAIERVLSSVWHSFIPTKEIIENVNVRDIGEGSTKDTRKGITLIKIDQTTFRMNIKRFGILFLFRLQLDGVAKCAVESTHLPQTIDENKSF